MRLTLYIVAVLFPAVSFAAPRVVQLALDWKPEPEFGGFYAADIMGEYKKHGLDVKILPGGSGTPTVQMLAAGQVEYAIASAEEILLSNERNPKNRVVALFAVFQTNPQIIMCHSEKNFHSLKDVFATPVTLSWQSGLAYAQFLRKKYPEAKVKFVPDAGGVANFLANPEFCQQGFATSEPLTAQKAGAKVTTFLVADEGFNPYTTVLATREKTLDTDPGQARSMVEAVRAGWVAYLRDPHPTNVKMHELNSAMDEATFAASAEAQRTFIETPGTKKSGLGSMTKDRWVALQKQMSDLGIVSGKVAPEKNFRGF